MNKSMGGCHCGQVRFEVSYSEMKLLECNCTVCSKKGYLHLIVEKDDFKLLSGDGVLTDYRFGTKQAKHLFCKICGVQSFYIPRSHPDGVSVNARCLEGISLQKFDVVPFDGSRWEQNVDSIR